MNAVELLLNAGAQIEAQSERTKDTALSLACSGGRKEVTVFFFLFLLLRFWSSIWLFYSMVH